MTRQIAPAVFFLIIALLIAFTPVRIPTAPAERFFRVEAAGYAFHPAVLHANPGDIVTIELVAKDVAHGLAIDGYPVEIFAEPGQPARATFVVERAGSFKLRCVMPCGNLHPFMTGKFVAGPNLLLYRAAALGLLAFVFGAWRAAR